MEFWSHHDVDRPERPSVVEGKNVLVLEYHDQWNAPRDRYIAVEVISRIRRSRVHGLSM